MRFNTVRHRGIGPSYLLQTRQAIEGCSAFVVIISRDSMESSQIDREVVRAHESGKRFVPVLRDVTYVEFERRRPDWQQAVGSATAISVPKEGVEAILGRLVDGLKALGIVRKGKRQVVKARPPSPVSERPSQEPEAAPSHKAEAMIGMLLNERYRLDAEAGRGGMSTVYRAHDLLLDRDVGVKVLSASKELGTKGRARILREAQFAARLNHPNIVSVYDAGEAEGVSFIVMELVEGPSLADRRPQDLQEIVTLGCQVCAALEHAHAQGIIHRDLKPANVLVAPDGTAKLADLAWRAAPPPGSAATGPSWAQPSILRRSRPWGSPSTVVRTSTGWASCSTS